MRCYFDRLVQLKKEDLMEDHRNTPRLFGRRRSWMYRTIHGTIVRLKKYVLRTLIIVPLLAIAAYVGVGFSPKGARALYHEFSESFRERYHVDDQKVEQLYGKYFHEQSIVYASDSKIACYSSPEHRILIESYEEIPEKIRLAILASEDKSFFVHNGVDGWAIARAGALRGLHKVAPLFSGTKSGASTLTMQLAKKLRGREGAPATLDDKIAEALIAFDIEDRLNKYQIFLIYVNMPYFGRGQYGIEAASRSYFGKSAKELDWHEAAYLVALINRPALPDRKFLLDKAPEDGEKVNRLEAKRGAQRVLDLMRDFGEENTVISKEPFTKNDYANASTKIPNLEIKPAGSGCASSPVMRSYVEQVRTDFGKQLLRVKMESSPSLNDAGFSVYFPSDEGVSVALEQVVSLARGVYEKRHKKDVDIEQLRAGAVAMRFDGKVLGIVGNIDTGLYKFNVMTQGYRQPGSTAKAITYTAFDEALMEGILSSPNPPHTLDDMVAALDNACTVLDAPILISRGKGKPPHVVQNFSRSKPMYFMRNIPCALAVGESRNTTAVRAGQRAGVNRMVEVARRLGIKEDALHKLEPYPTMAIGGFDARPIDMARVFATIANGGFEVFPSFVEDICSKNGKSILHFREDPFDSDAKEPLPCSPGGAPRTSKPERILHPAVAQHITSLLRNVVDGPTSTAHSIRSGVIMGQDPFIYDNKSPRLKFTLEDSGEMAGKTGSAANADRSVTDAWLILLLPGPVGKPEEGVVLVFWMGKDNKHSLGSGETGGRIWTNSAVSILDYLKKNRGLLSSGNKFAPLYPLSDEELSRYIPALPPSLLSEESAPLVVDPYDLTTDDALLKGLPSKDELESEKGVDNGDGDVPLLPQHSEGTTLTFVREPEQKKDPDLKGQPDSPIIWTTP